MKSSYSTCDFTTSENNIICAQAVEMWYYTAINSYPLYDPFQQLELYYYFMPAYLTDLVSQSSKC